MRSQQQIGSRHIWRLVAAVDLSHYRVMRDRMMETDANLTGRVFGSRYRLVGVIGEGGMAAVYEGHDAETGGSVAIKVLRSELTRMVGEDRFTREIQIAQQLDHPNIVPLLDSGVEDHLSYYVMPLVKGGTLRRRIADHAQLTVEDTLDVARAMASALAHAHAAGIVHRDIKPENILLDGAHVYVSDFGIARLLDAPGLEHKLSTTGLVIGTPAYMSPEQSVADPRLDPRSDIYSMGCVMYEMLAGTAPFTGATPQAIAARHMVELPPPLRVVRPNVPRYVATAIERCLAKSPAERFQSMAELLRALDPAMEVEVAESRKPRVSRVGLWWVAAAMVLAAVLAGAYWKSDGFGASGASGASGAVERYAVFPLVVRGDSAPALLAGDKAAAMLWEALHAVLSSQLVDRLSMEGEFRIQGVPTRIDSVRSMARALGAQRAIWGEVAVRGDSVSVYAQVYDARRNSTESPAPFSVTFALRDAQATGPGAQKFYEQFKLLGLRLVSKKADGDLQDLLGTDQMSALVAKLSADSARYNWNLPLALERYRDALKIDGQYAKASLGAAQIGEWLDLPVNEWRTAADAAFALKASLGERDAISAEALHQLGAEQFPEACAAYGKLLSRDSTSFEALFGLGECQLMDEQIVIDASMPTKLRFRGSYAVAQMYYDRAIKTTPTALRDDRAVAIDRLLRVFPTKKFLRPGSMDGQRYAAPPMMAGDSITFVPRLLNDELKRLADSTEIRRMETLFLRDAQRLTEYTAVWIRDFPASEQAWYAHALRLERTGAFDGDSTSSALYCIKRARALATDEHQRLQYAIDQLRILTRMMNATAVKELADSLLARRPSSAGDARLLSRVAALVGDSERLRTLLQTWRVAEPINLNGEQPLSPPRPVSIAASDLLWYSVTGTSSDSLAQFEQGLQRELTKWAPVNRVAIGRQYTTLPALLGFPQFGVRAAHREPSATGDLQAQLQFATGTPSERKSLVARTGERVHVSRQAVSADAACLDAAILAAAGDRPGTDDALARMVREMQRLSSSLLADFQAPAMMQRCRPLLDESADEGVKQFAQFLRAISR